MSCYACKAWGHLLSAEFVVRQGQETSTVLSKVDSQWTHQGLKLARTRSPFICKLFRLECAGGRPDALGCLQRSQRSRAFSRTGGECGSSVTIHAVRPGHTICMYHSYACRVDAPQNPLPSCELPLIAGPGTMGKELGSAHANPQACLLSTYRQG